MIKIGGVPTEARFRNLTEIQWAFLLAKFNEMKITKLDNDLSAIEYLAKMTSMNPKGVEEISNSRKRKMNEFLNKQEDVKNEEVLGEDEQHVYKKFSPEAGVNSSFNDSIKKALGDKADSALQEIFGAGYNKKTEKYIVDKIDVENLKNQKAMEADMRKKLAQMSENKIEEELPKKPQSAPAQMTAEQIQSLKAEGFDSIQF